MVNNEFKLIGTVVSEFTLVQNGNPNFKKYNLSIEVDKKKGGQYQTFVVTTYESNRNIDVNKDLNGKLVIVNGYLDCYKGFTSLVVQDMFVVGDKNALNVDIDDTYGSIEGREPLNDDGLPF